MPIQVDEKTCFSEIDSEPPEKSGFRSLPHGRRPDGNLPKPRFRRGFVGEVALRIDVIASGLPTNQSDKFAGRWGQKSGPVFGIGLGSSDFVPNLTLCETFGKAFQMLSLRSLAFILCSAIRRACALSCAALHSFPDIISRRKMATNNPKKVATDAPTCSLL